MNGIFAGAKVYRNYDHLFQQQLKADLTVRKIAVKIEIAESVDGFELKAHDESGIMVTAEYYNLPKNPARDILKSKETIAHQLAKSGDTPYFISGVETNGTEKFFFQASVLNSMRRDLLDRITEARKKKTRIQISKEPNSFPYPDKEIGFEGNISNQLARQFYVRHGVENPEMAFEKQADPHGKTVMTTKHCLKFQMGFCPKFGGKKPSDFSEPFSLNDGINELRLDFDCLRCVMKVIY